MQNEPRVVSLDIETYQDVPMYLFAEMTAGVKARGNLKDPIKIEADLKAKRDAIIDKAALSPLTGRVVSWALYDGEDLDLYCTVRTEKEEMESLEALDRLLATSGCTYLATKNGRKFDLPFLAARYALHNIVPEFPIPLGYHKNHIDVQDVFGEKLGLWAMRFGMEKIGDGSDVAAMVEAEMWQELGQYNLRDAEITWKLATRLLPILKG